MHIIEESGKAEKGRRVDAFVQSTDKNLMVPVGGSIISGYDSEFVLNVSRNYPGEYIRSFIKKMGNKFTWVGSKTESLVKTWVF